MSQSSSVMFSLQELERMEEERVRMAAEAEARDRESREQARRAIEAREQAERLAVERAEAEARQEVERRAREEAARLAAIQRAATEAARVEAEARVRAEERERERERDRLHAAMVEQARAAVGRQRTGATWGAVSAIVTACVAAALYLGVLSPRAEASLRAATADRAARDAAITDLRTKVESSEGAIASLQGDLAASRAEVARLQGLLDARPAGLRPSRGGPSPAGTRPVHTDPALDGFTSCPPGSKDPLCVH